MRLTFIALAVFAIIVGAWVGLPDIFASPGASERRLRLAAQISLVRSDLWARAANRSGLASGAVSADPLDRSADAARAGKEAEHALRLSPLLSAQWLLLAASVEGPTAAPFRESALTMAFFTGPGQRGEVPRRFALAAQSLSLDRPELCDLLRPDAAFLLKRGQPNSSTLADRFAAAPAANLPCLQAIGGGIATGRLIAPQ